MNQEEIVNVVEKYIRNENAKYAILIDGVWGIGKTFLYEHYLKETIEKIECGKNKRKKNIYISLYGISTVEALSKEILENYIIREGGTPNDIIRKGEKKIAGILGVACKAFSFSVGPVNAEFGEFIKKISDLIDVGNMVICFDDLERCAIPVNELFGYINNLIEHCNCKVLILADESNIGRIFANTNIEQKYQTILAGRIILEGSTRESKKDNDIDKYITIDELKGLNEKLYSDNYIYCDIKEKVIGKTCIYSPNMKELINNLIKGDKCIGSVIKGKSYQSFLLNYIDKLDEILSEIELRNLRIIISWLENFESIYDMMENHYINVEQFDEIVLRFIKYSIWIWTQTRLNIHLIGYFKQGDIEFAHLNNKSGEVIARCKFIEKYVKTNYLDEQDLGNAVRLNQRINKVSKEIIKNTIGKEVGEAFAILSEWKYLEENEIPPLIEKMILELKDDMYFYNDYINIMHLLLVLKYEGLCNVDPKIIQKIMIELIYKDAWVRDLVVPTQFYNKEVAEELSELYGPITEARRIQNIKLDKQRMNEKDVYESAEKFFSFCKGNKEYYIEHKSFMQYIDISNLIDLINKSSVRGIYSIIEVFDMIYNKDGYPDILNYDKDDLERFKKILETEEVVNREGKTREIAIREFCSRLVYGINRFTLLIN